MNNASNHTSVPWQPCCWPLAVRIMLTAFLAIIGCGYLIAIANLYEKHQLADGKEGLTVDDVRAVYAGLTINVTDETVLPSRMLTQIRTSMRQYLQDDAQFATLEDWLKLGGSEAGLDEKHENGKTPRRVLIRQCMRCHAESTGTDISREAPFGPDEFTPAYAQMKPHLASDTKTEKGRRTLQPQYDMPRLILISHIHMLSIPMFTLLVGFLFAGVRGPSLLRNAILPLPMLALISDFGGWWLARATDMGVFLIMAGGAVFGVAFGLQLLWLTVDMWRPVRQYSSA